ncbi:hypothetical protein PORCRE_1128 [Porphyromonas crevioricanis JCM 15906]|uniref:Uncharacterized protein n=1 Tax=Porphyromonas crevioricanis JCM 15906 TaxID=1305617 RepID=T1CHL8_9PORP|nr:hypothetical protein PORCRE_1128 [Porphyromonas crevioricanis JCM 15906]GAD07649.1 hypothetical protein PORCAN_1273 [Porphyromonas crevioricanis JCM 13913]
MLYKAFSMRRFLLTYWIMGRVKVFGYINSKRERMMRVE